jgi:hypothetical protein
MSSRRLSRLAVCTLASDTPITKNRSQLLGGKQNKILAELAYALTIEKTDELRGPGIAYRAVERRAHRQRIGSVQKDAGKLGERTLHPFKNDSVWQINDVEDHNGVGGQKIIFHRWRRFRSPRQWR